MCLIRLGHAMFGDVVQSSEEHTLRRHAKLLRRTAKWANRLSTGTAATRMLNQQALQMAVAYEIIREQRYRQLAAKYAEKKSYGSEVKYRSRADCCRSVIQQLQQQLTAYQPMQQQANTPVDPPQYDVLPPFTPQSQPPLPSAAIVAMPIAMQPTVPPSQPAPPAYSGPAFAHYPNVSQYQAAAGSFSPSATPSSSTSHRSSHVSIYSSYSERGSLQEPWLSAGEKQTMR